MAIESHLHWSFRQETVLFPFIVLDSFGGFVVASILTILICLSERFLTVALDKQWEPHSLKFARRRLALWRTWTFSMVTFLRLCYMLVAMTFHLGLIITIIATLSFAQFFIELNNLPKPAQIPRMYDPDSRPLLSEDQEHPLQSIKTRPRSKSKPDEIFIHPVNSNIARADAAALELGLSGDTERVQGYNYSREEPAWELGKGKDLAREMLLAGSNKRPSQKTQPPPPQREPFYIANSDSDSDD